MDQLTPSVSERHVLRPDWVGWYRVQARTDNEDTEPELDADHPDPLGFADDTGGIWLKAMTKFGPAEVTVDVLSVGAEPEPRGELAYDGQFYVEELDEDTGTLQSPQGERDPLNWSTRLEWGLWRAVIHAEGHETAYAVDSAWLDKHGYRDEEQPPVQRFWVSLIDTE